MLAMFVFWKPFNPQFLRVIFLYYAMLKLIAEHSNRIRKMRDAPKCISSFSVRCLFEDLYSKSSGRSESMEAPAGVRRLPERERLERKSTGKNNKALY
jgi:hypothetical protein